MIWQFGVRRSGNRISTYLGCLVQEAKPPIAKLYSGPKDHQNQTIKQKHVADLMIGGTAQSKKRLFFISKKKRVRLSTLQKKTSDVRQYLLVFREILGLRRQNFVFAKNGENNSTTMANFVFRLSPGLADYAEICLEGVSAGGLPTRLRARFSVSIR